MPAGGQVTHSHVLAGASSLANGFRPYRAPHNMSVPSAPHIGTDQGDTGLTCGAGGLYLPVFIPRVTPGAIHITPFQGLPLTQGHLQHIHDIFVNHFLS